MASSYECRCRPRCPTLSDCHAPRRLAVVVDYRCADCREVPVSSAGEVCSECSVEHACATCGKRVDPGDVYCDVACRAEDEAYTAGDARAEIKEGR